MTAGTAPSNVYVYFASKLEIVLAIYEPWFKRKILALEKAVAKKKTREQKIQCLVEGLLRNIADDNAGYACCPAYICAFGRCANFPLEAQPK